MRYISSCILFSPSVSFSYICPSFSRSLHPQAMFLCFFALLSLLFRNNQWQNGRQFTLVVRHGRLITPPPPTPPRLVAHLDHLISIFSLWWDMGGNCPDCQNNCTRISAHMRQSCVCKQTLHTGTPDRMITGTYFCRIQEQWCTCTNT